jgi:hypothetical protein
MTSERPNLAMYAWCEELAILATSEPQTEEEREQASKRSFELADNMLGGFERMAMIRTGRNRVKALPRMSRSGRRIARRSESESATRVWRKVHV